MEMKQFTKQVYIASGCDGCGYCVSAFECPAITFDKQKNRAEINSDLCVNCGQCLTVCSKGHIASTKGS